MSADRWALCPKCMEQARAAEAALMQKIQQGYGEISEAEYHVLLEELQEMDQLPDRNLREDWELGIRDGVFKVSYYAQCMECAFVKEFTHREEL